MTGTSLSNPRYRNDLTAELVRSLLDYDHLTGNFTWRVDRGSRYYVRVHAGDPAGCISPHGYIVIGIKGSLYLAHRLAWLWMIGSWPIDEIDHINRIRHDNRFCNLREANRSQNVVNSPRLLAKLSDLPPGVSRTNNNKRFRARIGSPNLCLGTFDTPEEASAAYVEAAQVLFGEFFTRDQHMTHDYDNSATQAEKLEVLKDTYLNRAATDADLAAQGRFKRETTTKVTGVPSYPQLPPSSPWANGSDKNLELPFGVDVNALGTEQASTEPELIPQVAASPSTTEVDRTGEEPVVGSTVAPFPATEEPVIGSFARRRNW